MEKELKAKPIWSIIYCDGDAFYVSGNYETRAYSAEEFIDIVLEENKYINGVYIIKDGKITDSVGIFSALTFLSDECLRVCENNLFKVGDKYYFEYVFDYNNEWLYYKIKKYNSLEDFIKGELNEILGTQ